MGPFNGKCMVGFTYLRKSGQWELVENEIDHRIKKELCRELCAMTQRLSSVSNAWLPHCHEGFLLEILGNAHLDGGSIFKKMGGSEEEEIYEICIEIQERKNGLRPRLSGD